MKKAVWLVVAAACLAGLVWVSRTTIFKGGDLSELSAVSQSGHDPVEDYYRLKMKRHRPKTADQRPNDWFYMQRAYPHDTVSNDKYREAVKYTNNLMAEASFKRSPSAVSVWTLGGPENIPGRITDVEAIPSSPGTVYAASAAGGVFKSTNYGINWTPVFDATGAYSIGDIAINPSNPDTLFVGTGEANPAFDTYEGSGIYRSINAGSTWQLVGLPNSYRIGRVIIDPNNTRRIFVAAGGKVFGGGNPDRGVYRSVDGGDTWSRMLYVSDTTACVDLAYIPSSTTLFAAMWERVRIIDQPRRLGGITSGVYRSTDAGTTWTLLNATNGLPGQSSNTGRIGVTTDPTSGTVYAMYSDKDGVFTGLYKSTNQGTSFVRVNDGALVGAPLNASWQGGWYFGQVRTVAGNANLVFALGIDIWKSTNGGSSWSPTAGVHADQHALWINPNNNSELYEGCDGGVNYSTNGGASWTTRNMPNTQYYAITIDPTYPQRLYGGAQDNGTERTLTGATNDWDQILGGDGFFVLVDPSDPNTIYAEYQNGNLYKSISGGSGMNWAMSGLDYSNERHGWNTPVVMDPSNRQTLYYGSNFLYKTTTGASYWTKISPDLTNGPHPYTAFGTITTISVAKSNGSVVYVGTDDGNVWVTKNGGGNWTKITTGLPNRWVTRVAADPRYDSIAYVTVSGYFEGLKTPHIYRTVNYGATWTGIGGNLPDASVNDVIPDPADSSTLFIATDFGVYVTTDLGGSWSPLGTGLPVLPVHDIAFDRGTRKLAAGTHGRSIYYTAVDCPGTVDTDGDGIKDLCDNCPSVANPSQADADFDNIGDACDNCVDPDRDGFGNPGYPMTTCPIDNCPSVYNPDQLDANHNGIGDACEFTQSFVEDTIVTPCVQLAVSSGGGFGQAHTNVSLDYGLQGDCANMYMYDGTPVLAWTSGGLYYAKYNLYGKNFFVKPPSAKPTVPTTDSATFQIFQSGTYITDDASVAMEKTWYAPKQIDSCPFVIQCLRVYSWNGSTVTGLAVGEAIDWDVPATTAAYNTGGFDASRKLIYQQGTGTGACQSNLNRWAGQALLGIRTSGSCIDTGAMPYGAYTASNVTYLYPTNGFVAQEIYTNMQSAGYSALGTATDQHSVMTFFNSLTLGPTDTVEIYSVITTVRNAATTSAILGNVDKARKWLRGHVRPACGPVSCCTGLTGNVDCDPGNGVDISDLSRLVDFLYVSFTPLCCDKEANVDGDPLGGIDISDLSALVDYLYVSFTPPAACQ